MHPRRTFLRLAAGASRWRPAALAPRRRWSTASSRAGSSCGPRPRRAPACWWPATR
ncbi:hypothetical protein [Nannocystis pusilla]|uniref:hypothetical protein n=1 Tax=Nannocystis pusilla TaxID=889268 RepID=UPI003B7A0FB3